MASPALEVPTLISGNRASCDRQNPTPLEFAPPDAVDQPGGAAAAGKADSASMAPAAANVSMARRARCRRLMCTLMDPFRRSRRRSMRERGHLP